MVLNPQAVLSAVVRAAEDKRAHDIVVLDIRGLSVIADYFVIASGQSKTHVQAIAGYVREKLEERGIRALRCEGLKEGSWVLLDYGDVVVHFFLDAERRFYNLERLWGDAKKVDVLVHTAGL